MQDVARKRATIALSDEQMGELVALLLHPEKAEALLPQAERDHYRRCQESVVESRRAAEREAWQHFVY
jgi:hypothetical protein